MRTYHAYTMTEALAAVKRDLGPDAVILQTRSFRRGGFLGLGRRVVIEVTASTARDAGAAAPTRRPRNARPALRAYGGATPVPGDGEGGGDGDRDRDRTRKLAEALLEARRSRAREVAAPLTTVEEIATPVSVPVPVPVPVPAPAPPPAAPREVAERFELHRPQRSGPVEVWPNAPAPVPAEAPLTAVHDELAAIRQMVGSVIEQQHRQTASTSATLPSGALFDLYLTMVGQDLSEEFADVIVNEVREALSEEELGDAERVRAEVVARLAAHVPVADTPVPERSPDGRPLIIALVGPTGVGKTTTVAKLAAAFKLRHGRRVGLVTADTYRIAAVEQLRTYANIIGLPLEVVLTPDDMAHAMTTLADREVIIIDTAGRSQNDAARLQELRAFIAAADPHEVHLVLSSTAGEKVLLREAEAFDVVGIDKVVLTKLDEAVSFGMLIDVVRKIGKSLSFFTTGQEVPEHLETVRSERLVELTLGAQPALERTP